LKSWFIFRFRQLLEELVEVGDVLRILPFSEILTGSALGLNYREILGSCGGILLLLVIDVL